MLMDPYSCLALTTNVFLGLINHFVRLRVAKTVVLSLPVPE